MHLRCDTCGQELEPEAFMSDTCISCLLDDIAAKELRIAELEEQLEGAKKLIDTLVNGFKKVVASE